MSDTHDVSGRRSRYAMEAHSGRFIDPTLIQPEDVLIEDIAYHLAGICRFSGACRVNVADHPVRVAKLVELFGGCPASQYEGLMHDAHEYVLNDMTAPLGRQEFMKPFETLKVSVQRAIDTALPGPSHHPKCEQDPTWCKTADTLSALLEADALLPSKGRDWSCGTPYLYGLVEEYRDYFPELYGPREPSATESEIEFLRVWNTLRKGETL